MGDGKIHSRATQVGFRRGLFLYEAWAMIWYARVGIHCLLTFHNYWFGVIHPVLGIREGQSFSQFFCFSSYSSLCWSPLTNLPHPHIFPDPHFHSNSFINRLFYLNSHSWPFAWDWGKLLSASELTFPTKHLYNFKESTEKREMCLKFQKLCVY